MDDRDRAMYREQEFNWLYSLARQALTGQTFMDGEGTLTLSPGMVNEIADAVARFQVWPISDSWE